MGGIFNFNFIIMQLIDQFITPASINTKGEAKRFSKDCEKIAENFAIGFIKWVLENQDMEFDYNDPEEGLKELLEIYKKTL